jgi:hypothetical protein
VKGDALDDAVDLLGHARIVGPRRG